MNIGLAEALPAAAWEDILVTDQQYTDYGWSDLLVRRIALGLTPEALAQTLGVELPRYRSYETGGRPLVNSGLVEGLIAMEAFVATETAQLIDSAPDEGTVILHAAITQEDFTAQFPQCVTMQLRPQPYPIALQYTAIGRSAAQLRRQGRDVEVYRGELRFDLPAARAAGGLSKAETVVLLGLNKRTYDRAEDGTKRPKVITMAELQAYDDFITDVAAKFEPSIDNGWSTIWVTDDQTEFEKAYPEAVVERSGMPYPVKTLWIAAGRRAGVLEAAGKSVLIAAMA